MPEAADLDAAIAALWEEARPRMLARVDVLAAVLSDPAGAQAPEGALAEAHTLAGTLGAFGRMEASDDARAAERALADGDRDALAAAVRALREGI